MTETYYIDGDKKKPIICQDVTYGFLFESEQGTLEDTKHAVVMNGASVDEEFVFSLRRHQVEDLYKIIIKLTYPELYNEDGSRKDDDNSDKGDVKKKA